MNFKRPKIIGTLTIQKMMAGNFAVINDIKNSPNKIIVPCRSLEHGQEIIEKIKNGKFGDMIHLQNKELLPLIDIYKVDVVSVVL